MAQRRKTRSRLPQKDDLAELPTVPHLGVREPTGSQEQTVAPTLKLLAYLRPTDEITTNSLEFHMTIQSRVTTLTDKQASMLLAVACYRAIHLGVDFTLYLTMEWLYNRLWKNGTDPLETRNQKVRHTLLVADVIFAYIRGQWFNFIDYEQLPLPVVEDVEALGWLPSERTFQSWRKHWQLETYFEIKIVPVEALLERSKYSQAERYSGYTRGYGNDGSPAHPGRTRHSPELDGEDSDRSPPQLSLQEFEEYQTVIRHIEYAKARRRQQK